MAGDQLARRIEMQIAANSNQTVVEDGVVEPSANEGACPEQPSSPRPDERPGLIESGVKQ
jgi:hypothetical protein